MEDEEMAFNSLVESTEASTSEAAEAPLSKKAQKKLAKKEKLQEWKLKKRILERESKKAKTKALRQAEDAGTLTPEQKEHLERTRELKRARKAADRGKEPAVWPGGIVIDLGFDDLMTEGEITSMTSQLTYVYSQNRTAKVPFAAVVHTSLSPEASPRLWDKMTKANWQRWNRMHFWAEDVGELAKVMGKEAKPDSTSEAEKQAETSVSTESGSSTITPPPADAIVAPETNGDASEPPLTSFLSGPNLPSTIPPTHKLVYLSADAEEEITELAEDDVYVIGGIVDRNRYKNLCQNKAEKLGIRTARLPIGTFLENLPTRKVLTVNQVFEILVHYLSLKDWAAAFEAVIPQRKYFHGREEKRKARADERESQASEAPSEATDSAADSEAVSEPAVKMDVEDEEAVMNG